MSKMNDKPRFSFRFVQLALCSIFFALGIAGCGVDSGEPTDRSFSEVASEVTCTPGYRMCETCWIVGGNSAEDCIVQCNSTGNGWVEVENCGWAQNFPYSSSCYPAQPPRCEWN